MKFLSLILIFFSLAALADDNPDGSTNLPLPRFASLKSNEINVRAGPGLVYPIKWVYTRKNLPVEIIAEYEYWRKIRDVKGDEGWIHRAMLSGFRYGIISKKQADIFDDNDEKSEILAKIEQGTQIKIKKCDDKFCKIEVEEISGYLLRDAIWGIYKDEPVKD
jgi:SH3-like domain-containing protein